MISSEQFEHLYSDSDSSALNQSIGTLLTIIDAFHGEDSFEGNFLEAIQQAQQHLNESDIPAEQKEQVQHLIHEVKKLGPPELSKSNYSTEKPKFLPEEDPDSPSE